MEGAAMMIGRTYAYRESPHAGKPMSKVTLVDKVGRKGKIKIRWEDGEHPGLEEYVGTRNIICAWGDMKAVLRDEERETRLAEHAAPFASWAIGEAVSAVLASSGERGASCGETGTCMDEEELRRIFDRAGIDTEPAAIHYLAFRDRHGSIHLPLDAAVEIAQAFAAAEPTTVTSYVEDEEQSLRERGEVPGDRWYREYLREKGPAHALVRQWAGPRREAEDLRKEIGRLRRIITRASYELQAAGDERGARRLERALRGD